MQRDFGIPILIWSKSISIYNGQSWFSHHSTSVTQNNYSHAVLNLVDYTVEFQPKVRNKAACSHKCIISKILEVWRTTLLFSKMLFVRFCSKRITDSLAEDVFKQWKLLYEQQDINSNGICQKRDNQYQENPVSNTECRCRICLHFLGKINRFS